MIKPAAGNDRGNVIIAFFLSEIRRIRREFVKLVAPVPRCRKSWWPRTHESDLCDRIAESNGFCRAHAEYATHMYYTENHDRQEPTVARRERRYGRMK